MRTEQGASSIRDLNRRKSFGYCLFRSISPPMKLPPQAVIGGSSPVPPEPRAFGPWTSKAEITYQDESALFPLKLERNRQTYDVMLLARRLKAA